MKRVDDNDNWRELNNITKYVTGKGELIKPKRRFLTIIISLIMVMVLTISTFFIGLAMQSAFNINNFKQNIVEESIIVDMNDAPIYTSNKSLRLLYFEEETKTQVFDLLTKEFWWKSFFSTAIANYDFTYYQSNSDVELDKSLIQSDGFVKFDLKIKLKFSFIEFKIPVIVLIKNTDKFYEKFMMFNQFEGRFSNHISGSIANGTTYLPEEWAHGYLPNIFYYSNTVDNKIVYQTIKNEITKFISDYEEEFTSSVHLFPIITTIPLPDINFNEVTTIIPYWELINNPQLYYVGNAAIGDINEYVNLNSYASKPFYITYVSNPNIVYDLIELNPTSIETVINYLKNNSIDFLPFSMVQMAADNSDTLVKYSPKHTLLATAEDGRHFKYSELGHYFAFSNSINNGIETVKVDDYSSINDLQQFLTNKYWESMYHFALNHRDFFALHYPNSLPPVDTDNNWMLATNSLLAFKKYFTSALNVPLSDLTTFTFLDINGNDLLLKPDAIIIANEIKKIRFHVGKDLITSDYDPQPHSFNFTFKIKWI